MPLDRDLHMQQGFGLRSYVLLLGFVLALASGAPRAAQAQPGEAAPDSLGEPAIVFSGSARLFGQIANRRGTYQYTPDDFARLELGPTLSIYNVPFTLNVLLSTEQSSLRQNINSVSFDLDYHKLEGLLLERAYNKIGELDELKAAADAAGGAEKLRDSMAALGEARLRDLELLKDYSDIEKIKERALSESLDKLDELGLVSASEKFFAGFPALSVGVTYPSYTGLTLNGVPVTGANVEWNPGQFYVAFAGGKAQRAISVPGVIGNVSGVVDSVFVDPYYTRNLYAGRIGYGKKEGSHVILTAVYSKDDASSLPFDTVGAPLRPSANYVVGIDVNVPIVEDYFTLSGEVAGSMLTGDIEAAAITENDIPEFVRTTFDPNISSLLDYAFAAKAVLRIPETDTRLSGSLRKIGPAYFSLGAPTLRNDNLRLEGRLEQRFARGLVSVGAYYRSDEDNLSPGLKTVPATITAYGISLGFNPRNLPYVRLEYAPYRQSYTNVADATEIVNTTTLLSASSGYFYKIGTVNAGTTAMFSSQQSNTFQGLSDYGVATLSLSQNVRFAFPLALQAGFMTSGLTAGDSTQRIVSVDLSASHTAFDIWTNTAGFTLADQSGSDNNVGFFVASSIPVWSSGFFEVRAEKNVYKNLLVNTANFDEFLMTATFSTTW